MVALRIRDVGEQLGLVHCRVPDQSALAVAEASLERHVLTGESRTVRFSVNDRKYQV